MNAPPPAQGRDHTGTIVTVDVIDFASTAAAFAWRRRATRALKVAPGVRFAKALTTVGSAASGGFAPGRPAVRRQVLLTVSSIRDDPDAGERGLLADIRESSKYHWRAVLVPVHTRGSFHGQNPFRPIQNVQAGTFAALTLGRATPASLTRFLRHGAGLADQTAAAPGLITALTAGVPLSGNMTFSLWESEANMLRFAYGDRPTGHLRTVDANRRTPILAEQVNARLRVIATTGAWDPRATLHPDRLSRLAVTPDQP